MQYGPHQVLARAKKGEHMSKHFQEVGRSVAGRTRFCLGLVASLMLMGCEDPASAIEDPIFYDCSASIAASSVTYQIQPTCVACSVANEALAADGSPNSSADLMILDASTEGGVSLRAASSSTYSAGRFPGAFVGVPSGQELISTTTVRTYLDGVLQEESPPYMNVVALINSSSGYFDRYYGFRASRPFDEIELSVSRTSPQAVTSYRVYEICSDATAN